MSIQEDIRINLEKDLNRARTRYNLATAEFRKVFSAVPSGIPFVDGYKRMELVARERNVAVKELAEAAKKWSEFLLAQHPRPRLPDDDQIDDLESFLGTD